MEIRKTTITIRELCAGYVNDTETDIERGVWAYDGKLCVRPEFQRSFVYDAKQANAVIAASISLRLICMLITLSRGIVVASLNSPMASCFVRNVIPSVTQNN